MLNHQRHGSGPPLVLQHGFLGGAGDWLPLFATFGRHFDVIAPDFPGFAGSSEIEAPDSVAGFAGALLGFLDELGIERTSLLGHSMGSMVALQIALDHPDRLERLVLYGSTCTGNLPDRFEPFEASIARLEQTRGRRVRRLHRADLVRRRRGGAVLRDVPGSGPRPRHRDRHPRLACARRLERVRAARGGVGADPGHLRRPRPVDHSRSIVSAVGGDSERPAVRRPRVRAQRASRTS